MNENDDYCRLTPVSDTEPLSPQIEPLIYQVRGYQVMLDSDLARLYGVDTRRLNEQVKRNLERFPEDFMFQLSKEEVQNLMSQFATSSWGGTRKQPYAFTENGVAMLSSVLRSKTAIEVNIRIMRAFSAMRGFMMSNARVFQRLETLEHHQLLLQQHQSDTDKKIEEVLNRLDSGDSRPVEGFFFEGQIFDAYALISDLIRMARTRIVLIDNYVDDRVLKVLTKRAEGVSATIYTDPRHSQISNDLRRHNAQYPRIDVKHCSNVHDRFLIIDDAVYLIGGSIKDLGKKIVAFSRLHQNPGEILVRLR